MRELAKFLIAIWLIGKSTLALTALKIPYSNIILPVVAMVAGIAIILHLIRVKIPDIGLFLLASWLVLHSSLMLFSFQFSYQDKTLAILGVATGFFLLIRK